MKRVEFLALFVAVCSIAAIFKVSAAEKSGSVYLEILRSPPNRHVIAMHNMEDCLRAAQYSKARCVTRQPRLPDSSRGVLRSLDFSLQLASGPATSNPPNALIGKDFGPVYLVVRQSPPNRYVIAMSSMKKCLEAAAYSSAKCVKKLPRLPDASTGQFRSLANSSP